MSVKNCKKCGKMFNHIAGSVICKQCRDELEHKFQEVKEYIYDNPGADINEVSNKCKVTISQIKQWIREDRLQFSDASLAGILCEKCGKVIKSGRFCEQCSNELVHELNNAKSELIREDKVPVSKGDSRDKMRYLKSH